MHSGTGDAGRYRCSRLASGLDPPLTLSRGARYGPNSCGRSSAAMLSGGELSSAPERHLRDIPHPDIGRTSWSSRLRGFRHASKPIAVIQQTDVCC